jgi:hypothetical protein
MDLSELGQALQQPRILSLEPRKSTPHLIRDKRRDILLMQSLGLTEEYIAAHLSIRYKKQISLRQVIYTIQMEKAIPRKRVGRPVKLTDA